MSRIRAATAAASAAALLAACGAPASGTAPSPGSIAVRATSGSCALGRGAVPAGPTVFAVTNDGTDTTRFAVTSESGDSLAEVDVDEGTTRELAVVLDAGSYAAVCTPTTGPGGVRSPFTVAGTVALAATDAAALARAAVRYKAWLVAEAVALLEGTREFLDAVRAGEVARAKALYPSTRLHWERFETIAESFGDLDASIDSGEADVAVGQAWTGWHRFEKALWVDASLTGLEPEVGRLASDTALLVTRVRGVRLTPEAVVTAARELLDEIATGKVPGLEEPYSRTDLWDLKGNLDGARAAFDVVADIVRARNAALHDRLLRAFDALQAAMDAHRRADGFVRYDELSPAQVKELAVRVDALAEPLSELPGAVIT